MDGNRFDEFSKALAAGRSRRGFLKVLVGGLFGGALFGRLDGAATAQPTCTVQQGNNLRSCTQNCNAGTTGNAAYCQFDCIGANTSRCTHDCYGNNHPYCQFNCYPTAPSCPSGQFPCANTCTDLCTSATNCGTCGTTCAGNANGSACVNGTCGCNVATDCPTGQACNTTTHTCSATCGSSNTTACNGGCCNAGTCAPGTANTACGTTGGACTNCTGNVAGSVCLATGVCGCNVATDCPTGNACNTTNHTCTTTCSSTQLCNGGCCNTTTNTCAPGTATNDCGTSGVCTTCPGGATCTSGACVCPSGTNLCGAGTPGASCCPTAAICTQSTGACTCPSGATLCGAGTSNVNCCPSSATCTQSTGVCTCPNGQPPINGVCGVTCAPAPAGTCPSKSYSQCNTDIHGNACYCQTTANGTPVCGANDSCANAVGCYTDADCASSVDAAGNTGPGFCYTGTCCTLGTGPNGPFKGICVPVCQPL